jgi:hypothetical protein
VRTSTFRIDTEDHGAEITVKQATVYDQMVLQTVATRTEVTNWEKNLPLEMRAWSGNWAMRYAAMTAYTISIKNDEGKVPLKKDMTLEEFLALDAGVETVWTQEIVRINPYMQPTEVEEQREGESRAEAGEGNGSVEA